MVKKPREHVRQIPFGLQAVVKDNDGTGACRLDGSRQAFLGRNTFRIIVREHIPHHDLVLPLEHFDLRVGDPTVRRAEEFRLLRHQRVPGKLRFA